MAVLAFLLLFLAMSGHSTATWCVCRDGLNDSVLQKTLDYACGAGADCGSIHQNGAFFQPNTVKAHCSYAVNSYFQKNGQAQGSCDFAASAIVITSNPSITGCVYPSSSTGATPSTNTPLITTTNPYTGTSTGVLGEVGSGLSSTIAAGINTDNTHGETKLLHENMQLSLSMALLLSTSWFGGSSFNEN